VNCLKRDVFKKESMEDDEEGGDGVHLLTGWCCWPWVFICLGTASDVHLITNK
jgi:hypothetical protein